MEDKVVEATGRHVNYARSHRWAKRSDRNHKQAMGCSRIHRWASEMWQKSKMGRRGMIKLAGRQEGYGRSHRLAGRYNAGKVF